MRTSNLLSLGSLLGGLSELGTVKRHLFRASREILLAVNSLLGFADQYVSGLTSETVPADRQEMLSGVIRYAQKTLRTITRQLPRGDEAEYRALHHRVMGSILEVLDIEIKKSSKNSSAKARMKVDVLQAIRNVLLKEMDEEKTQERGEP